MRIPPSLAIVFAILMGSELCIAEENSRLASTPPWQVMLLGDSIRINYQQVVRDALKDKAIVWTPKDNCQHTAYTLDNLDRWLKNRDPDLVHINVGLHDMFLNAKTGKTRHSLKTYKRNLQLILEKLAEITDATIVFALTTAVDENRQQSSQTYGRLVRRNRDVDQFNAAAREIAKEQNILVNDLNAIVKTSGAEHVLRQDGIHLSPAGCQIVGNRVAELIEQQLTQQTPSDATTDTPSEATR